MHQPVLIKEILEMLAPRSSGLYLDGCLGAGGYAEAILEVSGPNGQLLGFDVDNESIERAERRLKIFGERFRCWHAGYHESVSILESAGIVKVDGIIIDLGLSSDQLEDQQRGFSFKFQGPLDMRFDRSQGKSALDLLHELSETKLGEIISNYGEEPRAIKIAHNLKQAIKNGSLENTEQLCEVIVRSVGRKRGKIHPATRVFQALRIAVNDELNNLKKGLEELPQFLNTNGRLCIVSYHSLEDRLVKTTFKEMSRNSYRWRIVTPRPVRPSLEETRSNPRSRSAKLRVIESL
ncbi:MAG: 16S rRNA (cytosine(1402)-N(4))-methyltransferase RsmH [Desulfomonilaceae bacterium]